MSLVQYNSINLPYPLTTRFSQEAVDDDVGHVDWCLTKFDIQVQCLINAAYIDSIAPQFSGTNPSNAAAVMKQLRTKLLQRRKQLSFSCNGEELIPARAGVSGYVDARNGPTPISCDILTVQSNTFLLNFHVVAHYWENYGSDTDTASNRTGNPVLFNRWSETVSIDDCNFSRRTRNGTYRIRSDNVEGQVADQLRGKMAVVGVPNGFVRESSDYTIDPDGLTIQYRVTDREVFKMPPQPAFSAEGEYRETATQNGAVRWAECRVKLKGSKFVGQADLVELAVSICAIKLHVRGAKNAEGDQASGFALPGAHVTVSCGMYDNWAECSMRARMVGGANRLFGIGGLSGKDAFSANFTWSPYSNDNTVRPLYRDRGTAGLLLQAARYYDPNLRGNELNADGLQANDNEFTASDVAQMTQGKDVGTAGRNAEA